ncbi:hypothetical protein HJD18_10550 [Thermoleophilia bacterium SCSIO 60948]|nr:hypothetical protein HJD18_10550 [Thermoleophilia bacterium SCSIO 60948]
MARALILGGEDRALALAEALVGDGWAVWIGVADEPVEGSLDAPGAEAVVADPARLGSVVDAIEGVAVIAWLLGDPGADPEAAREINGGVLARLFEEIVDTPVRGVAYEGWGAGEAARAPAERASETWRIGVASIDVEPGPGWLDAARRAVSAALG